MLFTFNLFFFVLSTIFINFKYFVPISYPQIHNTVTKILGPSLNSNKNPSNIHVDYIYIIEIL